MSKHNNQQHRRLDRDGRDSQGQRAYREMLGNLAGRVGRIPVKLRKVYQGQGPRRMWAGIIKADKQVRA